MSPTICELFRTRRPPLLSFEFFPPRDEQGLEALKTAAAQLRAAQPDFVTVTYGAGGSTRERTFEICALLRDMGFGPVMPHLTCVGSTRNELEDLTDEVHRRGYRNVMALRGDPPKGESEFRAVADGLAHASDLVALAAKRHPDFCLGVAGYPETHPEAESADADIAWLKRKTEAGAGFVTTQLFFDNAVYFSFLRRCRNAGILLPILPGLLPAVSLKQAQRMTVRCKASLPPALAAGMEAAGGEGGAAEEVGIAWAARQIDELLREGAPGIHLYVLNRSNAALTPALVDCFARYRSGL